MKIICNKAKTHQICNICQHAKSHEVITLRRPGLNGETLHRCTEWAPCGDDKTKIKVRCVKIKEEQ
jgi:hypothetical protein